MLFFLFIIISLFYDFPLFLYYMKFNYSLLRFQKIHTRNNYTLNEEFQTFMEIVNSNEMNLLFLTLFS